MTKKLLLICIIVLLIFVAFQQKNSMATNTSNTNNEISKYQQELDRYKQKEMEQKQREEELQKLQNPEIVNKQLSKIGKIIVYEGIIDYNDVITEGNWLTSRKLNLNLKYRYGIGIDMTKINVGEFYGDTYMGELIKLDVPKNGLKLMYLELDTENTKVVSTTSWLTKQFKPEDVKVILQQAQKKTEQKIQSDKGIYIESMKSLKANVKKLVQKLGYSRVVFEEI